MNPRRSKLAPASVPVPVPVPAVGPVAFAALLVAVAVMVAACGKPAEAPSKPLPSDSVEAETSQAESEPAFDYPGGWLNDEACVDICGVTPESPVERPPAVVCFDPDDEECQAKTGEGDYDYLLLSQHWLPSFCHGLAAGYDSTVTHQAGARCVGDVPDRLTVHGLWPNYTAGFPQCCGAAEPLDPTAVLRWPDELRERLQTAQPDPTTTGFEPALCEIFNHEWQKHGTCYADSGDANADARLYFETGLDLADQIADATAAVEAMAGSRQATSSVEALYPKDVQVLCDARKPERLLEIRTCWSRGLEMQDCPESKGFGALTGCRDEVVLPGE